MQAFTRIESESVPKHVSDMVNGYAEKIAKMVDSTLLPPFIESNGVKLVRRVEIGYKREVTEASITAFIEKVTYEPILNYED